MSGVGGGGGGDGAGPSRAPKRARTEPATEVAPVGTRVFQGGVSEWLKCPICLEVVTDPVQLKGAECTHFSCRGCLLPHLRRSRMCPECRSDASPAARVEDMVVRSLSTQHRLDEMMVHCRFGLVRGEAGGWSTASGEGLCAAVVRVGDVEGHEAECPFAAVTCPYAGCGAVVQRRAMEEHERGSLVEHLSAEHAARVVLEGQMESMEERVGRVEQALQAVQGGTDAAAPTLRRGVSGGGRVVSGSLDKTLRVWSVADGTCERVMQGHTEGVYSVASLGDGRVVSGSLDKTLRVWSVADGTCERVMQGHTEGVYSVASLGDGRVVSGSLDKTLRVWSVADGSCERVLEGHMDWVLAVASMGGGRRVVSGSCDETVRVWSVTDVFAERVLEGHTDWVRSVVSLPA